jgi:hypothetical protein
MYGASQDRSVKSSQAFLVRIDAVSRFFFCVIKPDSSGHESETVIVSGSLFANHTGEAMSAVEEMHPSAIELRVYKEKALQLT